MYLPKCHDIRTGCFARTADGRCETLKDTKFSRSKCPFYKSSCEISEREIEECIKDYAKYHEEGQE